MSAHEGRDLTTICFSYIYYIHIYRILQDSHQLSTSKPGYSRYHVRSVYYTRSYLENHYHPPRWIGWYILVQIGDSCNLRVDWRLFLDGHSACYCL